MADDIKPIVEWNRETDADGNLFNQEFSNIYNTIPGVLDTSSEILQMKSDGTAGFERAKLPEWMMGPPADFDFQTIVFHYIHRNGTLILYENIKNKKVSIGGGAVETETTPAVYIKFNESDLEKNFYFDISAQFAEDRLISVGATIFDSGVLGYAVSTSFGKTRASTLPPPYFLAPILKGWYRLKPVLIAEKRIGCQFVKL